MRQPIDIPSLEKYLSENVKEIRLPLVIKQFEHGQSNPTYQLNASDGNRFVLRKKPPGKLLNKAAHQVEREYKVLHALQGTDVPVPKVYCLCEDNSVVGTPFYIMEFLDGRIFKDAHIPEVSESERLIMWKEAVVTLAKLHRINPASVGLSNFGRATGFYNRQIKTLCSLGESYAIVEDVESKEPIGKLPSMDSLLAFFSSPETQPRDRGSITHGDYKIDNLVFHKTEPRIIGILDWEISTIGHPLSDLSNMLTPYTITQLGVGCKTHVHEAFSTKTPLAGLPTKDQCLMWYTEVAGWDPTLEMPWADGFCIFRTAVMLMGIAARYAIRQTRGSEAYEIGADRVPFAKTAENIVASLKSSKAKL